MRIRIKPFFIIWGMIFLLLEWRMVVFRDGKYLVQSIGVWLDWPMHFSFMSWFANQPWTMWFQQHPFAATAQNNYPPLLDLLASLSMRLGLDAMDAIRVTGFICALYLISSIYSWILSVLQEEFKAGLAVSLFFLSFGAADAGPVPQFVLGCFLNSPAFMLGLALMCDSLQIFHLVWNGQAVTRFQKWYLSSIPALLVLIHLHSLVCLFFLAGIYAIFSTLKSGKGRFWLMYGISAAVIGLPVLWWQLSGQMPVGAFQWSPWMVEKFFFIPILEFWWKYTGFFLPLALFAVVRKKYFSCPIFWGGLVLLAIYNFIRIQSAPYDNIKLMVVMYLLFCVPIADWVGDLLRKWSRLGLVFGAVICLVLTVSGAQAMGRVLLAQGPFFPLTSEKDRQRAEKLISQSNPQDVILAPLKHHHWALQWTGHPVVLGMRYFLWVHGIPVGQLDSDVAEIYAGGPKAIALLQKYSVRYVIVETGPFYETEQERQVLEYGDRYFKSIVINQEFFEKNFPVVMDNGTEKVFRMTDKQE
jgi:hypothetical protein